MKKNYLPMLSILLLGLLLSSCSSFSQTDSKTPSSLPNKAGFQEDFQQNEKEELKIVSGLRKDMSWGCTTERGLYGLAVRSDGSLNVTYLDYNLGEEIILCSQPGCLHNSESCTGWFPAGYGSVLPITDGKYLYFMFSGNTYGVENGVPPRIIRKDLNGHNELILLELSSGEALMRPFVSDGHFLYCTRKSYKTTENGVKESCDLISINTSNGDVRSLSQWDSTHIISLEGIVNNSLVFLDISPTADDTSSSGSELPPLVYTFTSVDPYTGTESELWAWGSQEAINGCDNGRMFSNYYFYYDVEKNAVMQHDFLTGQTIELAHDVPDLSVLSGGAPFDCLIDDILYVTNGSDFYAAISMKDMSITEILLSYPENNRKKPVRIIDKSGTNYLVVGGSEETIVHGYDPEGLPIEFPSVVDKIALISKEDYLSSRANFKWLTRFA